MTSIKRNIDGDREITSQRVKKHARCRHEMGRLSVKSSLPKR